MEVNVMNKCATMLRQQQAEIEALKKQCADIHENGAQVIDRCDKKIEELIEELNNLQVRYDKLWDEAKELSK
jgi:peptidoglycan hydrolase CwlO-like protein